MQNQGTYWLLVGHEFKGNKVTKLYIMSNQGQRRTMTVSEFANFSKKASIINAGYNGNSVIGKGISMRELPKYKEVERTLPNGAKVKNLEQVDGGTEQFVIQKARPLINEYLLKQKEEGNTIDKDKQGKIQYLVTKLMLCDSILIAAKNMKTTTNTEILEQQIDKYLVKIDVDNMDNSLRSKVRKYGVLGLARGTYETIQRCKVRAVKFDLVNENISNQVQYQTIGAMISNLEQKVDYIIELHHLSKELVKQNKSNTNQQNQETENNQQQVQNNQQKQKATQSKVSSASNKQNELSKYKKFSLPTLYASDINSYKGSINHISPVWLYLNFCSLVDKYITDDKADFTYYKTGVGHSANDLDSKSLYSGSFSYGCNASEYNIQIAENVLYEIFNSTGVNWSVFKSEINTAKSRAFTKQNKTYMLEAWKQLGVGSQALDTIESQLKELKDYIDVMMKRLTQTGQTQPKQPQFPNFDFGGDIIY